MSHATATHGHHAPEHPPELLYPNVGHVVPLSTLFGTFAALIGLTFLTVWVAQHHLGAWDIVSALTIATVKATLVCLYFMHLRWDRPILSLFFLASFFFVALFVGLALIDSHQYNPDVESRQMDQPVDLKAAQPAFFDQKPTAETP